MFCSTCGKEIFGNAEFCSNCGTKVNRNTFDNMQQQPNYNNQQYNNYNNPYNDNRNRSYDYYDNGSVAGWGFLGAIIPIVGLILFIVWHDQRPRQSKAAGIGALIGFFGVIILSVIMVFSALLFWSSVDYYAFLSSFLSTVF